MEDFWQRIPRQGSNFTLPNKLKMEYDLSLMFIFLIFLLIFIIYINNIRHLR